MAGLIAEINARQTRDNRRYYLVTLEDLSGRAELAVWNDVIEVSEEGVWTEGQIALVSVDCRERGDRLNLSVRRAAPWDAEEGRLVGFTPELWQVEERRGNNRRRAPASRPANANGAASAAPPPPTATATPAANGAAPAPEPAPPAPAATTEAERPGVRSPVGGEGARLVITVYETEDEVTDKALLDCVAALLRDRPGDDEVHLVIHDTEGLDQSFDFTRATVNEELARSIEKVLAASKGTARLVRARPKEESATLARG